MKRSLMRSAVVALVVLAMTASALPAGAGASRTRPKGSAARPGSGHPVSVSGQVTRGSAPTRVSGRATYGYYDHRYSVSYPGSYWWYWGWPYYYGYWWWGWPYPYAYYPGQERPRPQTGPALVETDVQPKKSDVVLDGALVGQARDYNGSWDVLWLEPGVHSIEFRREGYMTLRLYLDARAGGQYRITERLEKGEGLDPRSMEQPPERPQEPVATELRPGGPGEARRAETALEQGLLRIEASPADAAVYLDGEFLARADELGRMHGALPVALGRHLIEVVRPGFEGQRTEVQVDAEKPVKVTIDLSPRR